MSCKCRLARFYSWNNFVILGDSFLFVFYIFY